MTNLTRRHFIKRAGLAAAAAALAPALAPWRALAVERTVKITAVVPVLARGKCLVLVRTDAGVTGIGECSPMNSALSALFIEKTAAPLLRGMNALEIERCWEKVYYATYKQGVMGIVPESLAGIDLALWDVLGKVGGLPVHELIGGRRRESVRMYSSIGGGMDHTPAEMARMAESSVKLGFTAVKIRMDYTSNAQDLNVKKDMEILKAVRSAIGPEIELKYDVNNGYTVSTAIRVGKQIEEFNVNHYEEPLAQTDYRGYAEVVRAVDIPVAAGEHEYTRWQFMDLIEQANVDILQPDLTKCAGMSEAIKIAALSSTYHKTLVPHMTQPTIGQTATLHFTSVFVHNDTAQELAYGFEKFELNGLFKNLPELKNGRLAVPDGPGWGLELDEKRLLAMQGA